MGTEKQNEANRQNAQSSTGPRTDEGKFNSSRNSFKHGMCAKIHMTPEDEAIYNTRFKLWSGSLAPDNDPVKLDLIGIAVRNFNRTDRSLRADEAEAMRRIENSELFRQRDLHLQMKDHLELLEKDAPMAVLGLQSSLMGCDWLIGSLKGLSEGINKQQWKPSYHPLAKSLLGFHNGNPDRDIREVDTWARIIDAFNERTAAMYLPWILADWQTKILTTEGLLKTREHEAEVYHNKSVEAEAIAVKYLGLIDAEIERLKGVREGLVPLDELDKASAKERALVDTSPEGKLRLRYIAEAQRDMYKALDQVAKIDTYMVKLAGRGSRNEANPAPPTPSTDA